MNEQNIINHVVLVLDASGSMAPHERKVPKVADEQIAYLAQQSKALNQETRVTVYVFNSTVQCVIYDMDVLRLPSIAKYYRTNGSTALLGATLQSLNELAETAQRYGNHSFLMFVLTDGENTDQRHLAPQLAKKLQELPDNWTVAVLVPDQRGVFSAKKYGFPAGNITTWDAMSDTGVEDAMSVIQRATTSYMTSRSTSGGIYRGSKSLFDISTAVVNRSTVMATGIVPLDPKKFMMVPITHETNIKDFIVVDCGRAWQVGRYMFQLTKPEKVQSNKMIAIVGKRDSKVYLGDEARTLLGLPDMDVTVKPNQNPDYAVYVQSTSNNRKLVPGTKLLILL